VALIYFKQGKQRLDKVQKVGAAGGFVHGQSDGFGPEWPVRPIECNGRLERGGRLLKTTAAPFQRAVEFGEAALALLQGSTVTIKGHARSYPTQPIKESLQPRLKRIRDKVEACCKKRPQRLRTN
jgi:hypothetical protein